jgi:hypothetical protein
MYIKVFFSNNNPVQDTSNLPVGLIRNKSDISRIVSGHDTEIIAIKVILFHTFSTEEVSLLDESQSKPFFVVENRKDGDKEVVNVLDNTKEVVSSELNIYQSEAKLVLQGCGRYRGQVSVEKGYIGQVFVFDDDACLGIHTTKGPEIKPYCVSLLTGEVKYIPDSPFWFRGWDMPYIRLEV